MVRFSAHVPHSFFLAKGAREIYRDIVDFYSAQARLVVELDGSQHYEEANKEKDAQRTAFLENYGLTVVRVANNEVNGNFQGVCAYIDAAVRKSLSRLRG